MLVHLLKVNFTDNIGVYEMLPPVESGRVPVLHKCSVPVL